MQLAINSITMINKIKCWNLMIKEIVEKEQNDHIEKYRNTDLFIRNLFMGLMTNINK
jgi:hypothetical protein